jgi:minor extracellular serine protease Vpr
VAVSRKPSETSRIPATSHSGRLMRRLFLVLLAVLIAWTGEASGSGAGRYILILDGPPVAQSAVFGKSGRKSASDDYRRALESTQSALRRQLESRRIAVAGAVQTLLNAMFVQVNSQQAEELDSLPGVRAVMPAQPLFPKLNRAVLLASGPSAWEALGGVSNAGAGVKIAVLDSGIDRTHPSFQDDSLAIPTGFPKCGPGECAFTNRKVIVARSYVGLLAAGTPPNPAIDSRPDDTSPDDRVGHGTAVAMAAAGVESDGPLATIRGMAPKAWLGNYKVFGSPGIHDSTSEDVLIMALEDALDDGMDIAILSLGRPALTGPLDEGAVCGQPPGTPCDPIAFAVENAVSQGLTVVVAAGNEGGDGTKTPTLGTVSTPATAPSAISVGAVSNSHIFASTVEVPGEGVPENLRVMPALLGDGVAPSEPLTAPMLDVAQLGNDGLLCRSLPPGSLNGSIALIQRGECLFADKLWEATLEGAVGVVFYLQDDDETLIRPGGLANVPGQIPAMLIGNANGKALKEYLRMTPGALVTMDPEPTVEIDATGNTLARFSSRGPSTGAGALKPELVAAGTSIYTAAQQLDAGGELYSTSRYAITQGTSFSAPLVAGAAALVKQKNPDFTVGQVKSALVNTASPAVTDDSQAASVYTVGAGSLNAEAAVWTSVTVEPAAISFGELNAASLPRSVPITIHNSGTAPVNLALQTEGATLSLSLTALSVGPGQSKSVDAALFGPVPAPGIYGGVVKFSGAETTLRVPYLYGVGDGVAYNLIPVRGDGFVRALDGSAELKIRVIDRFGLPVRNAPVQFTPGYGNGSVEDADSATNQYGIAAATVRFGKAIGSKWYTFRAGDLSLQIAGTARLRPEIRSGGVVNAASFETGTGAAPGSYISIFGTALGDAIEYAKTPELPPAIDGVSVSFDVPSANLSLAGRLHVVAPGQVNTQVPWELGDQPSVLIKVSNGRTSSELYELPLSKFSPGVFEAIDHAAKQYFAAALDEDNKLIDSQNGAQPGRVIQLFVNGLGPVDNPPQTGVPTPLTPLSRSLYKPTVTIAGRDAEIKFSGLAPTAVGLYQINLVVPPDTPPGIQPLVLSIGGVTAKTVNLPVK